MEAGVGRLTRIQKSVNLKTTRLLLLVIPLTLLALGFYVASLYGLFWEKLLGKPTFEVTTLMLAVMAIIFGVIQFRDAWKHTEEMEDIADSVSTRYIGNFPKNLKDVVNLTTAARRELLVMADFVNYGHYWKPEGYEELLRELELARDNGVKVRFLVHDEKPAMQVLQRLLPEEKCWPPRASDESYEHFFFVYPGIERPKNYDEFLSILRRKGREAASQLFDKGVQIKLMPNQERLFFCVEDDEEAVFSLENVGDTEPLCFRTRDAKLIKTLKDRFEGNWNSAKEYLKAVKTVGATKEISRAKSTSRRVEPTDLPPHSVLPPEDSQERP
jgi:hypothetical protein